MNILFICNQGRHRSRTAADLFRKTHFTDYAGLYSEKPMTKDQLEWADLIVVMEDVQRAELGRRFPAQYLSKRIVCLDIPDTFSYGDPRLVEMLQEGMEDAFSEMQNSSVNSNEKKTPGLGPSSLRETESIAF